MARNHVASSILREARPFVRGPARLAAAACILTCAVAAFAEPRQRVQLREIDVPRDAGLSVVAGGDDGSAYLHGTAQTATQFAWRRLRSLPDGSTTTIDVADDPSARFTWFVTAGSGTTAFLSTSQVVLVDADDAPTHLAGTLGKAYDAAMRGGVLHVLEERPGAGRDTVWGAEVLHADGSRRDVPDLGVIRDLGDAIFGPTLPGLGDARAVVSSPTSIQMDAQGRLHATFLVRTAYAGDTPESREIATRTVDSDGNVTVVALPDVPPLSETPGLQILRGEFRVADDGTEWFVRTLSHVGSGQAEFTDIAARAPGGATATTSLRPRTRGFGGRQRFLGDVAADGRFVAVTSEVAAAGTSRTLQLVWRRFDSPSADGTMRSQRRVLVNRLATVGADGGPSGFEARAYRVAVAPDGTCLVATATRSAIRSQARLRLLVVNPAGRIVFRHVRRVSSEISLDVAACGDRGFIVLPMDDSGSDTTAIHLVR